MIEAEASADEVALHLIEIYLNELCKAFDKVTELQLISFIDPLLFVRLNIKII